jgi:hypothetical protein
MLLRWGQYLDGIKGQVDRSEYEHNKVRIQNAMEACRTESLAL